MPPAVATVVYALAIWGFFWLDRDRNARTSKALWIPVTWVLIAASRPVSQWLQMTPPIDTPDQYLDGSPIDRLVFAGLLAAGVIVLVKRGRQVGTLLRANAAILLFFFYCGVSILWSDYPDVASKRWIKGLGDLVMVLIVLTDLDPSTAIKRFLARVGFLLVPVSVLLIKYYADLGRAYTRWAWTPVYTGVTTNKNFLGLICLIFGLGSLWRFLQLLRGGEGTRRARPLIAHGAFLMMVLWLFWMANSITSLSCFLLAASLMVATSVPALARKPGVVHLLVAAGLGPCFSALFWGPGVGLVETLGRDSTLTGRTALWSDLLKTNLNPLFGAGFESFWLGPRLQELWSIYWWHPNEAHNGYLEVFLNLGWMGVGLLALVMVTGYRNVLSTFRRDRDAGRLRLAYFVVTLIYNFTEAGFRMMNPVWIFFLLTTALVPEASVHEAPKITASDQDCPELAAARTHIYEEVV